MSDCSCVYFYTNDFEGPSCYAQTFRKARKTHRCYECHSEIRRGDRYEEVTGVWDGRPDRFRTCLDCVSVRDAFFCDGFEYGGVWEYLHEHLRNCAHTTPTEALARLTPYAREEVCSFIEKQWAKLDDE